MQLTFMPTTMRARVRGLIIGAAIALSASAGVLAQGPAPLVDPPAAAPVVAPLVAPVVAPAPVPVAAPLVNAPMLVDDPVVAQAPVPAVPPLVDLPKLVDAPAGAIERGDAVVTGFSGVRILKP
jgi:DNA polymerase-3 subunit gamma/tau